MIVPIYPHVLEEDAGGFWGAIHGLRAQGQAWDRVAEHLRRLRTAQRRPDYNQPVTSRTWQICML